jgi:N-acetylneuraminic acid mutarotase
VVNGKLYAIAGRMDGNHDRSIANNEEYDPKTDRWQARAALPTARSGIAAAVLDGKVFVFGGESNRATRSDVESFNPATNQWQRWTPMPTARHGLGAVVVGQSIYVIAGGPQPGASFSSVNEMFTP